jgi:uncharacterized protein (DUF4415 family)
MNASSKTDWVRVDAMADAEIDLTDSPELDATFFAQAIPTSGHPRRLLVTLDPEVFRFVVAQGAEYERLINTALRAYMAGQPHNR